MKIKNLIITVLVIILTLSVGCLTYALLKKDDDKLINENNLLSNLNFSDEQMNKVLNNSTCVDGGFNSNLICLKYKGDEQNIELYFTGVDAFDNDVYRYYSYDIQAENAKEITEEYVVNLVTKETQAEFYVFNKLENTYSQIYQENLNSKFNIEGNDYNIDQIQIYSVVLTTPRVKSLRYRFLLMGKEFEVTKEYEYGVLFDINQEIEIEQVYSQILNANKV